MKKFDGKTTSSHTTATDASEYLIKEIFRYPEISKISLGVITKCRNTRSGPRIKLTELSAGFKLTVRGKSDKQMLYIYLVDPCRTKYVVRTIIEKITFSST